MQEVVRTPMKQAELVLRNPHPESVVLSAGVVAIGIGALPTCLTLPMRPNAQPIRNFWAYVQHQVWHRCRPKWAHVPILAVENACLSLVMEKRASTTVEIPGQCQFTLWRRAESPCGQLSCSVSGTSLVMSTQCWPEPVPTMYCSKPRCRPRTARVPYMYFSRIGVLLCTFLVIYGEEALEPLGFRAVRLIRMSSTFCFSYARGGF